MKAGSGAFMGKGKGRGRGMGGRKAKAKARQEGARQEKAWQGIAENTERCITLKNQFWAYLMFSIVTLVQKKKI